MRIKTPLTIQKPAYYTPLLTTPLQLQTRFSAGSTLGFSKQLLPSRYSSLDEWTRPERKGTQRVYGTLYVITYNLSLITIREIFQKHWENQTKMPALCMTFQPEIFRIWISFGFKIDLRRNKKRRIPTHEPYSIKWRAPDKPGIGNEHNTDESRLPMQ